MKTAFDAPLFASGAPAALLVVAAPGDRFDPGFLVAACLAARDLVDGAPTQVVVAAGGEVGYAYAPLATYLGAQLFTCADDVDARAALGVVVELSTALTPGLRVLAAAPSSPRAFAADLESRCPAGEVGAVAVADRDVCPDELAALEDGWWEAHGDKVVGPRWRSHRNRSRRRLAAAWAAPAAAAA